MKSKNVSILMFILMLMLAGLLLPLMGEEMNPEEFDKKFCRRLWVIEEPFYPQQIVVDETQVYLVDRKYSHIYIFSKKDGKKIKVFGRYGEGPGEFLGICDLYSNNNALYISGFCRVSIFSRDGKMLKEFRSSYEEHNLVPLGKNYITQRYEFDPINNKKAFMIYILLDYNLKKIKDILKVQYNQPMGIHNNKEIFYFFHDCRYGILYKDRYYIAHTDMGFYIAVFDINGNKLYEIRKDYEKIRVTDKVKDNIILQIKQRYPDDYKDFFARRELVFPEFLPAFAKFFIYNDKIYVFKFPRPGSKGILEVIFLDLKGNLLEQKRIPFSFILLEDPNFFSYYNGKIYFLMFLDEEKFSVFEFSLDKL